MAKAKKRLAGPALVGDTPATKYTVPASTQTTITRINVDNPSGADVQFTLSIGADAAGTRLYSSVTIRAGGGLDVYGPFTMETGEIIQAWAGTPSVLNLTINGDVVT